VYLVETDKIIYVLKFYNVVFDYYNRINGKNCNRWQHDYYDYYFILRCPIPGKLPICRRPIGRQDGQEWNPTSKGSSGNTSLKVTLMS
jgi:hypothetical protein